MQIPTVATVISGFLLFGAAFGQDASKRDICGGSNCKGNINIIDAGQVKAKPATKPKGINCKLLLKNDIINCSGLSSKTCDFVGWLHAGCKKQPSCAGKTGVDAKKCCDDAIRLPFGAGTYYTGYMRACAPQYKLKRFDRPSFIDRPCDANRDCTNGLSKGMCDMYSWETAGCRQRAICDAKIKDVSELPTCCKEWDRTPQGHFSKLYQNRFDLKCLAK